MEFESSGIVTSSQDRSCWLAKHRTHQHQNRQSAHWISSQLGVSAISCCVIYSYIYNLFVALVVHVMMDESKSTDFFPWIHGNVLNLYFKIHSDTVSLIFWVLLETNDRNLYLYCIKEKPVTKTFKAYTHVTGKPFGYL